MANAEPLVDPTKPLNSSTKAISKVLRATLPQLQSILSAGEQRSVILNNQLYKKGQWVSGYQITGIESDAVFLRDKEQSYKLNLYTKKERFIK
ncbi:general secretion pathway protein GspB [Psychromonas antarctica]|uniref:general secretion pathway protein GspB n=1 Tax=Psychromonas antarctica TaxID=67573 RepID=UPI001EE905C9|nr:general secretion pathway protein GspB [Psychromonas antarctica]MCG6200985.1 general secretion pathway protein GspB [Psychromonas antarctica]